MTHPRTTAGRALAVARMARRNPATVNDEGQDTMTDTTQQPQPAPKGPPAWMLRDPLTRDGAAGKLQLMARALSVSAASMEPTDRNAASGLEAQSKTLARVAGAVMRREKLDAPTFIHACEIRDARLGCAKATTEPDARRSYMDEAHALSEAIRFASLASAK